MHDQHDPESKKLKVASIVSVLEHWNIKQDNTDSFKFACAINSNRLSIFLTHISLLTTIL